MSYIPNGEIHFIEDEYKKFIEPYKSLYASLIMIFCKPILKLS